VVETKSYNLTGKSLKMQNRVQCRGFTNFLLILIVLSGCAGESLNQEVSPPNIVLIISDDQGWGDLSLHGNRNIKTPHMDSLAINGASFTSFYVSPVCSPTRAEVLTGRYHPRTGVYGTSAGGERMNLDETTIAEIFRQAGYATGVFGKWHNGMQYPYHPNARGFDEFYGFASGHWGDYFSPALLERNGQLVQGEGYLVDDFTNQAMSFIENHKDEPFFAYIPYNTPHSPMQVPDKYWDRFDDREITMLHRDPELEDLTFTRAALAMVENIDWNVGRIMKKLQELGLKENTIVVYLSDNGPNSWRWNGGMRGRKGSVDEGGVRSPLFIHWPQGIDAGRQIDQIAAGIDLLPTLSALAGIPRDTVNPIDGVSLKPLLSDQPEMWPERLIYSYWNGRISVRSQEWRFNHEGQLHNMLQDPGQHNNLAGRYPDIAQALGDSLVEWEQNTVSGLGEDDRPFPVGHADFRYTQLPARDGIAHGHIERSNRFPNDSFFENWVSTSDSITWDVEVLEAGNYQAELYYTCPEEDVGSTVELSFGESKITAIVSEAHDPPLHGMEHDRIERQESYVKDFKPMDLGVIHLEPGRGSLTLKALEVPGSQVMDFRLIMLTRVE
jgi:arylsulfatase A-like enzyme